MYPHNPYFGIAPQYYGFVGIAPMAMPPPAMTPVPSVLPAPVTVPSVAPPPVTEAPVVTGDQNNQTALKYVRDKPPVTTVFVGNISEHAPDQLIKALLMRCGNILSWKRVQGASGKLQAFGFCEYEDPESTMRCVRLLNGFQVGPKALLVKVDPKTESLLDEYRKKKEQSGETGTLGATADEVDSSTLRDDENVKAALENMIKENAAALEGEGTPKKDLYLEGPRHLTIEDMDLDNDRKDLINREIEIFRKRHEKEDNDDTAPRRTKPYDRDRSNAGFPSYSAFAENERRDYRRDKNRRTRSRSSSLERARRLRGTITSSALAPSGKPLVIDDEEEAIRKKLERKLREKEESYQKRLKQWEAREKKKRNEYEHEREHERKRQRELQTEAQRLQEFFEDYDDNMEDPKYYRGSALHQRLKDREIEEAADERDRQKEIEQLETARRKLIEDGDPNAESIILQMEQKMQEHLRRRLNVNGELQNSIEDATEDNEADQDESPREEQKFIAINQIESDYRMNEDGASQSPEHNASNHHSSELEPNVTEETNGGLRRDGSNTFLFAMSSAEPVVRKTAAAFAEEESDDKPKKRAPAFLPPSAFKSSSENTPGVGDPASHNDHSNLPPASALSTEEKKAIINRIIEGIPTSKSELFAYPIDWEIVDADFINSRIKPWVDKKIVSYIGEAEATLSNFICERLLHHNPPERILRDIAMVLDEEAEVFVVKMWRLLIYVISEKKAGLSA